MPPLLKPVIARIPVAAAAVHPSAAPHILIIAIVQPLPEVDLPYADCPASIVFSPTAREYDCVLLGIPAVIIEKHTKTPLGNL